MKEPTSGSRVDTGTCVLYRQILVLIKKNFFFFFRMSMCEINWLLLLKAGFFLKAGFLFGIIWMGELSGSTQWQRFKDWIDLMLQGEKVFLVSLIGVDLIEL